MKKLLAAILCLIFIMTLVACAKPEDPPEPDPEPTLDKLNYLTGEFNMSSEVEGMRPYAVAINNLQNGGWPQYGISQADVVIEMVTEGGITRLMCLYADVRDVERIGPVRSLRDQFIEVVYPLDPIIVHIGASTRANRALSENNLKTLNGDGNSDLTWFDNERDQRYGSEHCWFTSAEMIANTVEKAEFETTSKSTLTTYFNFAEVGVTIVLPDGEAETVNFLFSSSTYDGDFRYDAATGKYLKFQRDTAHVDVGNNDKQLAFDNVLVMFANVTIITSGDEKDLSDFHYREGGEGYYFSRGKYEKVTWSKSSTGSNLEIKKADGTDLVLNTGKTYLSFVSNDRMNSLEIA